MEYMDAGSLDKLQGAGVPEDVLGRISGSMVRGLKFLKDELQIIHRGASGVSVLHNLPVADSYDSCRCEADERAGELER